MNPKNSHSNSPGHNTPLANAEFKVAFTETNLRYALGENPRNEERIAAIKAQLAKALALVASLKS